MRYFEILTEAMKPKLVVAYKLDGKVTVGDVGQTHIDMGRLLPYLYPGKDVSRAEVGFVNHKGQFLNRRQAWVYATENDLVGDHAKLKMNYANPDRPQELDTDDLLKKAKNLSDSKIDESVVGYHGSRAGDQVFKIGHSGNNTHTFGAYDSQRYGVFFSDNPKFAALYGNVKKYVLNIQDTADLNTPHIRQEFIESLDPFDPVDRPFWLTVRHATGQTWQLFEDQLGERFTKFLLDNGYDSATFAEYNEDSEGNEFKSNTIVVLKPELIRETKLTEGKIEKDHHGNKFALNPSPIEFKQVFNGFDGAAFYADTEGNVAFGGCKEISIDHSSVAHQFGLGKEGCRGYVALPECALQVEIWLRNKKEDDRIITERDQQIIDHIVAFAKQNQVLTRIAKSWRVLAFNLETAEILLDKPI